MATREENIKRINAELEKLTDEELDLVAGGNAEQTSEDSKFLNVILRGRPGQCDRYGTLRVRMKNCDSAIREAWKSVGVDATIKSGNALTEGGDNIYKIGGKTVDQCDAMQHAMDVVGKQLRRKNWDW